MRRGSWAKGLQRACDETWADKTFDGFCERLKVTPDEYPHAFAAWLGRNYDWDGRYERIDEPDQE